MSTPVEWIAAHRPTAEQLIEASGHMAAMHEDEWDSPGYFTLWALMQPQLVPMSMTAIPTDVSIDMIPPAMAESVARYMSSSRMTLPISAMSLMYEGWSIEPGPDGFTDEQKQAITTNTVHQLPDKIEVLRVLTVGVGGSAVVTSKARGSAETLTRTNLDGPVAVSADNRILYGAMAGLVDYLPQLYLLRDAAAEALNQIDGGGL